MTNKLEFPNEWCQTHNQWFAHCACGAGATPLTPFGEANQALMLAAQRAIPLLVRLGDFIGNGPVDPSKPESLGERCDVLLALKDALAKLDAYEAGRG